MFKGLRLSIFVSLVALGATSSLTYAENHAKSAEAKNAPTKPLGKLKALIVGISKYDDPDLTIGKAGAIQPLANAARDAADVAALLKSKPFNFDVQLALSRDTTISTPDNIAGENFLKADYKTLRTAWKKMIRDASKEKTDVVLFYFAGHAVEVRQKNYLLTKDLHLDKTNLDSLEHAALDLNWMLKQFGAWHAETNTVGIFILDACRDNPFTKNPKGKLAEPVGSVLPPKQVFIMYSAGIGEQASDGVPGENSVFASVLKTLLKENKVARRSIADLAQDIRIRVYELAMEQSKGHDSQSPAYYDQLRQSTTLTGKPPKEPPQKFEGPLPLWQSIEEGDLLRECKQCPELIVLPKEKPFVMGTIEKKKYRSEAPQHKVSFTRQIAMSKYEITHLDWEACVRDGKCSENKRAESDVHLDRLPVINVSYDDAVAYTTWLSSVNSQKGKVIYRLPTEAEWEFAARGGEPVPTRYSFRDIKDEKKRLNKLERLCLYANGADRTTGTLIWYNHYCNDKVGRSAAPVGVFRRNRFGLHDMLGNVGEWTLDCWRAGYDHVKTKDGSKPWDEKNCARRVVRGGSWHSRPEALRTAARNAFPTSLQRTTIGFRVVRELNE